MIFWVVSVVFIGVIYLSRFVYSYTQCGTTPSFAELMQDTPILIGFVLLIYFLSWGLGFPITL